MGLWIIFALMSSKISIFLTEDNEHWYRDCDDNTFVLEFSKNNISILLNDGDDLVIGIKPGTELYSYLKKIARIDLDKATI